MKLCGIVFWVIVCCILGRKIYCSYLWGNRVFIVKGFWLMRVCEEGGVVCYNCVVCNLIFNLLSNFINMVLNCIICLVYFYDDFEKVL